MQETQTLLQSFMYVLLLVCLCLLDLVRLLQASFCMHNFLQSRPSVYTRQCVSSAAPIQVLQVAVLISKAFMSLLHVFEPQTGASSVPFTF